MALGFAGKGVRRARLGCSDPWEKARWCEDELYGVKGTRAVTV